MDESIESVRRDLEQTRARMSSTVGELADRITHPVRAVRERMDVGRAIQQHPWVALGLALAAGVLVGTTGADTRAAEATASAAKRAGAKTKDGAIALVDRVRHRGDGARMPDAAAAPKPGLLARLSDRLAEALEGPLMELSSDLRRSLDDFGRGDRVEAPATRPGGI